MKFGEVALQPPELTAKPRTNVSRGQPGKKSRVLGMLLSLGGVSLLSTTSLARQRILAEERELAVQVLAGAEEAAAACLASGEKPETCHTVMARKESCHAGEGDWAGDPQMKVLSLDTP